MFEDITKIRFAPKISLKGDDFENIKGSLGTTGEFCSIFLYVEGVSVKSSNFWMACVISQYLRGTIVIYRYK